MTIKRLTALCAVGLGMWAGIAWLATGTVESLSMSPTATMRAVTALASTDDPTVTPEVQTPAGMCPQEDDCRADYRDGQWHIYRVEH